MPPPIAKDRPAGGSAGYSDQNPSSTQRGTSSVNYAMSQTGHKRSASSQGVSSSKIQRITRQTSRVEQNDIHEQLRKCEKELGKAREELEDRDQEISEYAEDYEEREKEVNHLKAVMQKLEKQKEKVERKNNQLAKTVDHYRAVFNDKGEESATLKRELASIKNQAMPPHQGLVSMLGADRNLGGQQQSHRDQDVRSYLNIIEQLKNEKAQLISRSSGLEKQLAETRGELLREISELQSKNNFNPKKISDTDIQRSWKHIGFLVRQFVDTFLSKDFSSEDLQLLEEKGDLAGVSSLCATPNAVLQCGMTSPLLMQALLWNFLRQNVFDVEAGHWAEDLGKKFSHVFGKLSGR
ncbi:hypothetical protein N0V85_005402 [Neurospora sp. IMI 360204]|nr:hypothetical protein N0V85_005402 [Neurospora sp. IMI 360204]